MAAGSKITTDHDEIRKWAEERDGQPATIKSTESEGYAGLLRINFPGRKEANLENITWEQFFNKFEEKQLAFLYQDKTASGRVSRFSKIISRNTSKGKKGSPVKSREALKRKSKQRQKHTS